MYNCLTCNLIGKNYFKGVDNHWMDSLGLLVTRVDLQTGLDG